MKIGSYDAYKVRHAEFEAELGDALGMIHAGKYNNSGARPDYTRIFTDTARKGFRHLELAAERGDAEAAYTCANMVAMPWFATKYSEPVYKYLKMADDAGYHPAAADMYWRYINGFYQTVCPNHYEMEDTVKRLKIGADAGDGECQFALALCYTSDFIRTFAMAYNMGSVQSPEAPDPEKFIHWLERAYRHGCVEASVFWAEYLAFGEIRMQKDPAYPGTLLYQGEIERDPALARSVLEGALEALEKRKQGRQYDMQGDRTDKFLAKARDLKERLEHGDASQR